MGPSDPVGLYASGAETKREEQMAYLRVIWSNPNPTPTPRRRITWVVYHMVRRSEPHHPRGVVTMVNVSFVDVSERGIHER
jgi:hypothetical protein